MRHSRFRYFSARMVRTLRMQIQPQATAICTPNVILKCINLSGHCIFYVCPLYFLCMPARFSTAPDNKLPWIQALLLTCLKQGSAKCSCTLYACMGILCMLK